MTLTRSKLLGGVLALLLVAGITAAVAIEAREDAIAPPATRAPTEAEATATFEELVEVGLGSNPADVCTRLAASRTSCRQLLDATEQRPAGPPNLVHARSVPTTELADGWVQGGLVWTLCGAHEDGGTYRGEVLVWIEHDEVKVLHPVWWSGTGVVLEGLETLDDGRVGAVAHTSIGSGGGAIDRPCPEGSGT